MALIRDRNRANNYMYKELVEHLKTNEPDILFFKDAQDFKLPNGKEWIRAVPTKVNNEQRSLGPPTKKRRFQQTGIFYIEIAVPISDTAPKRANEIGFPIQSLYQGRTINNIIYNKVDFIEDGVGRDQVKPWFFSHLDVAFTFYYMD